VGGASVIVVLTKVLTSFIERSQSLKHWRTTETLPHTVFELERFHAELFRFKISVNLLTEQNSRTSKYDNEQAIS
jgi:hypothetical protein